MPMSFDMPKAAAAFRLHDHQHGPALLGPEQNYAVLPPFHGGQT